MTAYNANFNWMVNNNLLFTIQAHILVSHSFSMAYHNKKKYLLNGCLNVLVINIYILYYVITKKNCVCELFFKMQINFNVVRVNVTIFNV